MKRREPSRNHVETMFAFQIFQSFEVDLPKSCSEKYRESLRKITVPESLLIKCQAGGLQPYLKRDFDADFFSPANVEEFSKGLVKSIQHFIQHNKKAMLDEMLDRFNRTQK